MISRLFLCIVLVSFYSEINGQDTLPHFSVINRNGKIILSWVNNFPIIKQISVQRSSDSLKNFKTILTLPDPSSVTNGFLDNNAPNDSSYYKLYILLDKGEYVFTKSQKPHKFIPPVIVNVPKPNTQGNDKISASNTPTSPGKTVPDSAVIQENEGSTESLTKSYQPESATSSTIKKRSDGLKSNQFNVSRPETYRPSSFVFTNPYGDITIVLPADRPDNFKIRFFDTSGKPIFEINQVKASYFTLDKSNFLHAGWFNFELFENGVLKEKNKVRIP